MIPLARLRRATWLSGALVLVLAFGLLVPVAARLGLRYWPFYVGLAALLLLALGWLERALSRRPQIRRPRPRGRLRILPGGKGDGEAFDLEGDEPTDKQRWLM